MELLQLVKDFFNNYQLETIIGIFICICFYLNHKNQQSYDKLLSDKENLRIRYDEAKHKLNNPAGVDAYETVIEIDKDMMRMMLRNARRSWYYKRKKIYRR